MSGKPSPDGTREFIVLLARMREAEERGARLRAEIGSAQDRLKEADQTYGESRRALLQLMHDMDVAQSGNYGWEGRIVWFLVELHKQLVTPESGP